MKLVSTALTEPSQGMRIAPGVAMTTTVLGWASATASTSAFWFLLGVPSSRLRLTLSAPSVLRVPTKTTAMSAALGANSIDLEFGQNFEMQD